MPLQISGKDLGALAMLDAELRPDGYNQ